MSAKHLRILVTKNGENTVNMTMPVYALRTIHSMIPESVLQKLEDKGIKVQELTQSIIDNGNQPQVIFEDSMEDGDTLKKYKVWIE